MQKSKKPRENQKKQKKQYSRSLEIGSTGKSPGTLFFWVFLFFLVFSRFFGFLHFYFCKSPGILFFLIFLFFFGFLEVFWIFAFLLLQESWNIVFFDFFVFFGFLEVFWKFGEVKEKMFFWEFCKIEKTLKLCKNPKVSRLCVYPWIFWEYSKNSVVCNLSVSFVLNCSHYHLSIICFHVLIHSVHFLNCSS